MTSFSISTKSILFFFSWKFVDASSLFPSLQNEFIWYIESKIVLTCKKRNILAWRWCIFNSSKFFDDFLSDAGEVREEEEEELNEKQPRIQEEASATREEKDEKKLHEEQLLFPHDKGAAREGKEEK